MSPRPLPGHGTYARANGSPGYRPPCPCGICVPARRAGRKRMEVNRRLGRPGRSDASVARKHLALLHTEMSWRAIAAATGCDRDTVMNIHSGKNPRATRGTLRKILAVKPTGKTISTVCIDATGTRRRIQALQAAGHTLTAIADIAGTTRWRLGLLAEGRQATVTQAIADQVADTYDQLAHTPAPDATGSSRTRKIAASKGWRDPLWWEDYGHIDDPTFDPSSIREDTPVYVRLAEDALWLQEQGYTRQQIGQRLREDPDYISASIKRYRKAQAAAEQVAA